MFQILGMFSMVRNVFYMAIGAFITLAFVSPDKFDDVRAEVIEAASGGYAYVQENMSTITEKSEEIAN
jgi:hypothetical protein